MWRCREALDGGVSQHAVMRRHVAGAYVYFFTCSHLGQGLHSGPERRAIRQKTIASWKDGD